MRTGICPCDNVAVDSDSTPLRFKSLPVHLHSEMVFPDINGNMVTVTFERACKRAESKIFASMT